MIKRILVVVVLFLACVANSYAAGFTFFDKHIKLDIIPEYSVLSSNTGNVSFILEINIDKDWHLYWDNPGDTGSGIKLINKSTFLKEIKTEKSSPSKFIFDDIITSYIYKDKLYIKSDFILGDIYDKDNISLDFVLNYTACNDECITEELPFSISMNIADKEIYNDSYAKKSLNIQNDFPIVLHPLVDISKSSIKLKFNTALERCSNPEYVSKYPKKNILSDLAKTEKIDNNTLDVYFYDDLPVDFEGILFCDNNVYKIEPNIPQHFDYSLFYYIITAFFAGLILNLMPCVLPILGLKALYLVQNKKSSSFVSALSYLLGVLSSFGILSGILFYLRTIGYELGWGFQLQSPIFNIFLLLLFFVIFLNLTDKLYIPDKYTDKFDKISKNKSFLMGFFAVIIACPCTGPFMGAALGYAITKSTIIYFSIFIALGFGYALPYTLIELFPRFFLKYIPKPGHWMITLKRILAFPIALTCLWLGWVIYNQLLPTKSIEQKLNWEIYDETLVEQALANKQAVFINFTAKWCLVCLLNDKTTLSTEYFSDIIKQNDIRIFKADWTTKDDAITNALTMYNRSSIPLYVFYKRGDRNPIILPQILSEDTIQNELIDRLTTE